MNLIRHLSTESGSSLSAMDIEALAKEQPYIEPWHGVDLDKTLCIHNEWEGCLHIGEPIAPMIAFVKQLLAEGKTVKIFTARVSYSDERVNAAVRSVIQQFCQEQFGQVLEVTNIKDMGMRTLYDDRARQVVENQGIVI